MWGPSEWGYDQWGALGLIFLPGLLWLTITYIDKKWRE